MALKNNFDLLCSQAIIRNNNPLCAARRQAMTLATPRRRPLSRTVRVLDRNDSHRFCIRAACLTALARLRLDYDYCNARTIRGQSVFRKFSAT